jgi:hypothetical protein
MMYLIYMADISRAYKIMTEDLSNQVFVNFPFEKEIVSRNINTWRTYISEQIDNETYSPDDMSLAEVPKPNWAVRPGSILNLKDHLTYTYFVDSIYDNIHRTLSWSQGNIDFAYQLCEEIDNSKWFENQFIGWKDFRTKGIAKLDENYSFVVVTDITGFYENIDHRVLKSDLLQIGVSSEIKDRISSCLSKWSQTGTKGIPQGLSASHLLAKLYLNSIDEQLSAMGFMHQHYSDDYRIFCKSLTEAKQAILVFSSLLREKGLNMQSSKTKIRNLQDARREIEGAATQVENLVSELGLDTNENFDDPYWIFETPRSLSSIIILNASQVELVRSSFLDNFILGNNDDFNKSLFRYLLNQLGSNNDDFAVDYCKDALQRHPHETSSILKYFKSVGVSESVENVLIEYMKRTSSIYPYQKFQIIDWLYGNTLGSIQQLAYARELAFDNNNPPYLRSVAKKVLGSQGTSADLNRLKRSYRDAIDDYEKGAIICSIHRLESTQRNAFYNSIASSEYLSRAIDYAKNM